MFSPLRPLVDWLRSRQARAAADRWRRQEQALRSVFFERAAAAGKPKGLRWTACDWTGELRFARDRSTGQLTALAGTVVRFEPIAGGDMEDVEAAALPRDAAAVFHYRRGRWGTGGRALFNMTPGEAVGRLRDQFDPVDVSVPAG